LELELQEPLTYIVNRGVFVLPITKSYCRVGSTFDNQDLSWEVTDRAKNSATP